MKRTLALLLGIGLGLAGAAAATADPLRYTVLLSGNKAGQHTWESVGGEIVLKFRYNDRGRGPDITERIKLDSTGLPQTVSITGHDYLKNPVRETFERGAGARGRATWSNQAEKGDSDAAGAFYLTFNGAPGELGLLARALLARPDGRLPLLPAGEARLERTGEEAVEGAAGRRAVVQYTLAGISFAPFPLWLESDGTFFGVVDPWFSVVREGYEDAIPNLVAAQEATTDRGWRALAARAARRPKGPLVVRNARLFDSQTLAVREATTVLLDGERIVAVGADNEVAAPAGAEVLDAGGRTLLPGLWDMHVHVGATDGPLHLAAGVTTVRDLANDLDLLARMRKQWDALETIGPRVVAAGFIDGPGPYAGPTKVLVDDIEQGREWVRRYAELGYRQIKL